MLIDKTKSNPFGAVGPLTNQQPQGILNIDTPQAPQIAQGEASMAQQGTAMLQDKALDVAMNKGTEMVTGALAKQATPAVASTVAGPAGMPVAAQAAGTAAGKGGAAAAGGAAGGAGTGLMAAAAPMAAPLILGGLLAYKLFK